MAGTLRQVSYFSVLPCSGGGTVPFLPIHTSQSIVTLANYYSRVPNKRTGTFIYLTSKIHPDTLIWH